MNLLSSYTLPAWLWPEWTPYCFYSCGARPSVPTHSNTAKRKASPAQSTNCPHGLWLPWELPWEPRDATWRCWGSMKLTLTDGWQGIEYTPLFCLLGSLFLDGLSDGIMHNQAINYAWYQAVARLLMHSLTFSLLFSLLYPSFPPHFPIKGKHVSFCF